MSDLVRLSFSIEQPLVEQLEQLITDNHYSNRSEFIRDLIRAKLVAQQWENNEEVLGTITLAPFRHSTVFRMVRGTHPTPTP
jgi:CopG family nickel-responsive transcriptional regulator